MCAFYLYILFQCIQGKPVISEISSSLLTFIVSTCNTNEKTNNLMLFFLSGNYFSYRNPSAYEQRILVTEP